MPTNTEFVDAIPTSGDVDQGLLRGALAGRSIYPLGSAEDSRDLIVVDPDTGDVIPALFKDGKIFEYAPLDTTTEHDGVTCLESNEGKRYLATDLPTPFSVLDKDLTAPISSPAPSLGDTYLIYGTPTGDWSGKSGYITIYTARGWEFILPSIGFRVYVEDEDAFYYRDTNGDWVAGLGSVSVGAKSVPLSALLWDWRVENQTTNNPPSSWSKGTAYIIGTPTVSPSNHWTGNSLKLAIAESNGILADGDTFTIYTPWVGLTVYNKALGYNVQWNGTAWQSASGAYVSISTTGVVAAPTTSGGVGSGDYTYSNTSAPTTGKGNTTVTGSPCSHAAKRVGAKLEIEVGLVFDGSPGETYVAATFRNSETTTLDWVPIYTGLGSPNHFHHVFHADALSNDPLNPDNYYLIILRTGGVALPSNIARYHMTIKERA